MPIRRPLLLGLVVAAACHGGDDPLPPPAPAACRGVVCPRGAHCDHRGECRCGSSDEAPVCPQPRLCAPSLERCSEAPIESCTEGTRYDEGTPLFAEATEKWGLAGRGISGQRISAVDLNGDGFPDLVITRPGVHSDAFDDESARHTWILMNRHGEWFEDVTEQSGLRTPRQGGALGRPGEVLVFADVDGDGDLDVYSGLTTDDPAATRGETSEVLLNDGTGFFTLGPEQSAIRRTDPRNHPCGATFSDFDLDGFVDLFVGQYDFEQDELFFGDGTGQFVEAGALVGITTVGWSFAGPINEARAHSRAWGVSACDLNRDGAREILVASYGRAPNHLWRAEEDASGLRFVNASIASGYAFDDNLEWRDNLHAQCYCRDHPQAEQCEGLEPPIIECNPADAWNHAIDREPFRLGGNSATVVCADLNRDGHLDLVTGEIRHWWAGQGSDAPTILENTGLTALYFERLEPQTTGLAIDRSGAVIEDGMHRDYTGWHEGYLDIGVFDVDNDGRLDLFIGDSQYLGTRARLYHQHDDFRFREIPVEDGFLHHRSLGHAIADFDGDGDLDIVVGHSRMRCRADAPLDCYETEEIRAFENILGQDGNYVSFRLEGVGDVNRSAIGARVVVTTPDGVRQTLEVDGGHKHCGGMNDLRLHFGLGSHCDAEVVVHWPSRDRRVDTFEVRSRNRYWIRSTLPGEMVIDSR